MSVGSATAGRLLARCALGLFALGFGTAIWGDGLASGFVVLGCLLISAAFSLPWLLAQGLRLAEGRSTGVLSQWFWADTRQQLGGLSMALMALMLAMAANIGVSTMVSSFRLTFAGYLDQRLAAELYLRAKDEAQAAEIQSFLSDRAVAVLPIVSAETRVDGLPTDVFGIIDHTTYRENWPLIAATPDVWDRLAAGEGALINEQMSYRMNLSVADVLSTGDTVLGIYSDYGNAAGQMIVSAALFDQRFADVPRLQFGVRTGAPEALARDLREQFDLGEDALINQRDLKVLSLEIFERTFSVTAALNVLTLGVAALAILISLLTLATMRLPQLAPVWALGFTRASLSRLEVLRAVCLAAMTCVLALPVGLVLAWVLLSIVNVEAFGWRLPMFLFPGAYVQLALLTILAGFVAALWPALRLARVDAQSLLKVFSNER